MSYKIDPDDYCSEEGCHRPKVTGEDFCALCLVRSTDSEAGTGGTAYVRPETGPLELLAGEAKLPRCIAYLSTAGDVITLELTGEPKFTEADVELVASALSTRLRKAA